MILAYSTNQRVIKDDQEHGWCISRHFVDNKSVQAQLCTTVPFGSKGEKQPNMRLKYRILLVQYKTLPCKYISNRPPLVPKKSPSTHLHMHE